MELHPQQLRIHIGDTLEQAGAAAARDIAAAIGEGLRHRETLHLVFAAAPSQDWMLAALVREPVDWSRIHAFHMDEYIGLDAGSPASFASYLKRHLFEKIACRAVHYINGQAADPLAECLRYSALLQTFPPDIVCMGIGENCHIAFNDPPVANFNDPETVKVVTLDEDCRLQQVHDGCFPSLAEVPARAITLTIPALVRSRQVFCTVPGERKAKAVNHTLNSPVSEAHPSTILRTHPAAQLYLDKASARLIVPGS